MSMSSVVIISLAAAVVLVIGGGLVMYMANLVRNAYELKVQIASDIDVRLAKMAEDLDKKSRWIKRDLIEEIEKIKAAVETENARRFQALAEPLTHAVDDIGTMVRRDRVEWTAAFDHDRALIAALDEKIAALRLEMAPSPPSPPSATSPPPIAAASDGRGGTMTAPAEIRPPSDPRTMSEFLPDLGRRR